MVNLRLVRIDENRTIICQWINTKYGFKHEATLMNNGYVTNFKVKQCYYNRTWERYEFESVLRSLLENIEDLTEDQRKNLIEEWNPYKK